uniref:NAD-dependent epimerase/dehydratase family protein n=1 Tax=candidate division CPR3 bacterium TaxID=2268181 RepID=A0A7C5UVG1_UNCC3
MKSKKVLVTGAAGFIGQNLVNRLLNEGAYVIAFDNFSYGKKENLSKFVNEIIIGDVANKEDLDKVKDVDYVFHFGAPSSVILFNRDPVSCFHTTVCGFLNILEWAKKRNIEKLIYPSSGSVYGNTSLPQSEDMLPKPVNLYCVAKLACETLAKNYFNEVPSVGLRIFAGYGPGEEHKKDFASVITLFLRSILNNQAPVIYGDGTQKRDFVYIDDVINSIIASVKEGVKNTIINVGSGKSYSFNEALDILSSILGKTIKAIYINRPTNYLENTLADITKMKKILKISPLSLEEGLKKYLTYEELIS